VIESLIDYLEQLRETTGLMRLLVPVGLVVGGGLLGLLCEKLVLRRLRSAAAKTAWQGDDIVVGALRGIVTLWFVLAGVYLAILIRSLGDRFTSVAETVLLIAFIFSVAVVLTRVAAGFIRLYVSQVQGLPSSSLLINIAGVAIFVLGALVVLQSLGVAITPILGALGVGGLAVALALQETLANFFSGIVIILSGQLRTGDFVRLESGQEGYVQDITWRNTTIRVLMNNMVIVPNSKLSSSIVTNYYQPDKEMAVIVPVSVSYDSDLQHVERVTLEVISEVLNEVEGGVPEFEPMVRYNNFGDFSIDFSAILRTREVVDQYLAKHEFIKRLHRRYAEEGIEIPFPIRTIRAADGSAGLLREEEGGERRGDPGDGL
jgi:small-conductance mechanosensitive channel